MSLSLLFAVVLLALTTVIHYEVLRLMSGGLPALDIPTRAKLMVVIVGAFFTHVAEISLYAATFYLLAVYLDAGSLGEASRFSFITCLYFSAETYTSLGYGDVTPRGGLRLLAGMEALNGLLLIGWSASYIYISMERFWSGDDEANAAVARPSEKRARRTPRSP